MRENLRPIAFILLIVSVPVILFAALFRYSSPRPVPPDAADYEVREIWVHQIWASAELIAFAKREDLDAVKSYAELEKRLTAAGLGKAWYAIRGTEYRWQGPMTDFHDAYLVLERPEQFERSKVALLALARKGRTVPALDYRRPLIDTMPPELASAPPHEGLRRIVAEQNELEARYAKGEK